MIEKRVQEMNRENYYTYIRDLPREDLEKW